MRRRHPVDLVKSTNGAVFTAPRRAPAGPTVRRSGATTHMAWAAGGFLLGAMCWNMVGFWGFVDRLLEETRASSQIAVIAAPSPESAGLQGTRSQARLISADAGQDCVQHVETGTPGVTTVRPCVLPLVAMQHDIPVQ